MDTDGPRSVFISYSWDSEAHKAWVRKLASRLTRGGVDVKLDQWDVGPGESLTQFMEKHIVDCDRVIVIATPTYTRRSQNRQGGVGYEQQIISGHIAAGVPRTKFIPVIKSGELKPGPRCAVPPHFSGILAIDMRKEAQYSEGVKALLRAIYDEPQRLPPKLGSRFKRRKNNATRRRLRLPIMELDGWRLVSGVAMHQEHPRTFEIPSEKARHGVRKGDVVKLIFEIAVPHSDEFGGISAERMWVRVTQRAAPYIVGTLANRPLSFDESDALKFGDGVVFLPEHIIQFYPKQRRKKKAST